MPDSAKNPFREPQPHVSDLPESPVGEAELKQALARTGRPGNPGRRCTKIELQNRIIFVANLLSEKRMHKGEVKRNVKRFFGVGGRMAESYISRARQYLIDRTNKPKEAHIADAFGLYEAIIRDSGATHSLKMQAQGEINSLLGLAAPTKIAPTTPDGEHSYASDEFLKQLSMDELKVLHGIHLKLRAGKLGQQGQQNPAQPESAAG